MQHPAQITKHLQCKKQCVSLRIDRCDANHMFALFSDDILKLKDLDERVYWDAHSIRARSFIMLKDSIKAAQSYKLLEKAPVGEIVAEATYFRAFLLNKEKKYFF